MNLTPSFLIYRAKIKHLDKKKLTLSILLQIVSEHTGFSLKELKSPSKESEVSDARHIFCWLAWKYTTYVFRKISSEINRKDHSSAINAKDKIEDLLSYESSILHTVSKIENFVKANYIIKKRI